MVGCNTLVMLVWDESSRHDCLNTFVIIIILARVWFLLVKGAELEAGLTRSCTTDP